MPGRISFIVLIVDLLWNTADKYKDHNEQYKSAEKGNLLGLPPFPAFA